ncbi:MAG: hypothetical protein ACK5YR_24780 [Pirellula sp.]|jgi:hypothetical protein
MLGRMPDARGFMAGVPASGGFVLSFNPDGSDIEIMANGFRNQYDIDFSPTGELFTDDADMEWEFGTPWYRPNRVNHVISGAKFPAKYQNALLISDWIYGVIAWVDRVVSKGQI